MDPYSTQMLVLNQLGHLSSSFIEHIRSILFALSLLVLGLIVAEVVKYLSAFLLRLFRWDLFSHWIGLTRVLGKVRADVKSSTATSEAIFWLILLSFFMKALILSDINSLSWIGLVYFDNLGTVFQATGILLVFLVLSRWLAQCILLLVENEAALLAASMTRVLVLALGLFSALQTLRVDRSVALPMVLILLGGAILALALHWAFSRKQQYRQIIRIEE
jgi:hypothetical protein